MRKWLSLAVTGIFLVSLPLPGWGQREVEPPAVPPILEGQRPLEKPDIAEPSPPKVTEAGKLKGRSASQPGKKKQTKLRAKKGGAKKPVTTGKKTGPKTQLKKNAGQRAKRVALGKTI